MIKIIISIAIVILIIIVIIIFYNYYTTTENKNQIIVQDIKTKVLSPSLLVLTIQAKFTTVINSKNDKILLVYKENKDDDDKGLINYTYLNVDNCQVIKNDDKYIKQLFDDDDITNPILFSFNYRLFLSSKINDDMRILSIQSKRTYLSAFKEAVFFSNKNKYYAITSLSPLLIYELDDNTFTIYDKKAIVEDHKWTDETSTNLKLTTTPIIVNNNCYVMGIDDNNYIQIINFTILTFTNINKINTNIQIENDNYPTGFIYNNLTNEFYICMLSDKKHIKIIKYIINTIK